MLHPSQQLLLQCSRWMMPVTSLPEALLKKGNQQSQSRHARTVKPRGVVRLVLMPHVDLLLLLMPQLRSPFRLLLQRPRRSLRPASASSTSRRARLLTGGRINMPTKKGHWIIFEDGEVKYELKPQEYYDRWFFISPKD